MIQIAYQPAYDPYHTAYRFLRLVGYRPAMSFKIDQLRILDFYLLFPGLISSIAGLKRQITKAGLEESRFAYGEMPSANAIFRQMTPIQGAAIQTLCLQGILDFDKELFASGNVSLSKNGLPAALVT